MKGKFRIITLLAVMVATALIAGGCGNGSLSGTMTEENAAASLEIDGEITYYETAAEAWNSIPTDKTTKMTLLKDWTADSDGNLGTGRYFNNGYLAVFERSTNLDLDLNNHTIDRGLTSAQKDGCIMVHCSDATVSISNGTLKGGNNTQAGGAIYFGGDHDKGRLRLYNVTITGCTGKEGSAIYYKNGNTQELTLENVTITGNRCTRACGGALRTDGATTFDGFYMHKKVVIKDNYGTSQYGNNLSLWGGIKEADTLSSDSEIYLYKPDAREMDIDADIWGNGTNTFKGQGEHLQFIKSVVKPENGYFVLGSTAIQQNSIYFYKNK